MNINDFIHRKIYESTLYIVRKHFITFVPTILLFMALAAVPVAVYFLLNAVFPLMLEKTLWRVVGILLSSVYYLSIILFFYSYFISYYLDVAIITNDRMVDIEQATLFSRTVAEVDLYQIQDATSEVKGFVRSLFNYGDVVAQTAGPVPKFILNSVPDPHRIRQMLLDMASADKKYHSKT